MKNRMKKIMALLLAGVMCVSLSACGSGDDKESKESSSTDKKTEAKTGMTIAQNSFVSGDYAFGIMKKASEVVIEGSQNTLNELTDNANINNVQSDVENMINSGVDGALWWGVLDSYFQVGPQQFNEAGVPFAFFDCAPSTEEIQAPIDEMEYYAGSCIGDNEAFGEQMAEQALADGCKEAIVFANEIGSSVAIRAEKFKEVFEAGGGKVDEISHVSTTSNAHIEATQNMLATYPDVDCIYGVSIAYALGSYTITSQMPDRKINIYATDITPDSLDYLKNNSIQGLNGGHWVENYVAAALLLNTIDGKKTTDEDGKPLNLVVDPVVITPATADLYQKFWIDEMPYSYDEIKNLLYRENPDVTAADFTDFVENYSVESVLKNKLDAGKVTQEELDAAGITIEK
ncbi:substrate-binding domain-containing protein [Lactonifactor sp. BIOML-A3]|uniref:sugar ABC transporter substrate-binding protein n=1 Tax=unclassified Lactonifactor TaxID=2636670 RepID=UPI0012AF92CF|nr:MULTISPECIES: sugar ABC transporter substrate-binding protein [unclassified Lactonifactor]MSA00948.1 substrate-binding domain-containing protein [Lactonifactor sp. BIOML-A5]MSA07742.1 substrate-binding domain-containing protein [Lactonifactor sp. BIOML-A4]MSA11938.1 substrate-binding domain-containing protein [Lactonifactor sp. BIOML-A3]MSA16378.1 substrate-binding domain-containing protein [Lactonifactor sp. BIOML-A2]MSA36982.1 substrate-binding domain-containing protein [Lactonifactor sp.